MPNPWEQRLGVWWISEDRPDHPAVIECPAGVQLTYGELAGRAHQLVHALRANGIGDGDVVAYALPNDIDIVVWQLATSEAGMHSLALNPSLSAEEVRAIVEHSGASAIVAHADHTGRIGDVSAPTLRLRVVVGGTAAGFVAQSDLLAGHPTTRPDALSAGWPIAYSSGTTGKPKGVWRDHPKIDPAVFADVMKSFGHAFQFLPFDGVHLVTAGMHHGGCQGFYLGALNVGQTLAIHAKFDAEDTLAAIERHRVTTAYMVPTQFVRLLRLPEATRARYDVSSLKGVVHAAAPCPLEVKRQMFEWWGPVIWETYGGTEGAATIAKPQRWLEKPGTVGRTVKGVSVLILDDDGKELPAGEVGHVYMRTSGPAFQYRNDPELTASVYRGDAFTIGDMGYLDDDGYLFLCDRAKDMIISGGVNIYPAEIEGVLAAHPAVGDVAVIGVPDAEWGEQVKAIVEVTDGVAPTDELGEELLEFCRTKIAGFKCPRTIEFRDHLPRTETGKLYKRLLRDEYWGGNRSQRVKGELHMTNVADEIYYDPYDFEIDADPYPVWRRLREEMPLYYNDRFDFFALSRFDDVEHCMIDWQTYQSGRGSVLDAIKLQIPIAPGNILMEDPPAHDMHRSLVSRVFTPRRMEAIAPEVRAFCEASLDPHVGSGSFDFVRDLGAQMPMRTIGMLLGVPEEHQEEIRDLMDEGMKLEDSDGTQKITMALRILSGELFAEYIDWRVDHPSDDLMTDLLNIEFEDETGTTRRLRRDEVLGYIGLIASAGNETTTRLISWTGKLLAEHPEQRQMLVDDRTLIRGAIEEILRYESPSPVQARYVSRDVEWYGTSIPEGSVMVILNGSGNRDDRKFEDGDRFDITRKIDHHLAFGYGLHFCLGAALARLEGRIALEEVLNRFPAWEIDWANAKQAHTSTVRGWERLPVFTP